MSIGDQVFKRRIKAGLSRAKLAKKALVHPNTIQNVELGNSCHIDTLYLIAQALDCTVQDLMKTVEP